MKQRTATSNPSKCKPDNIDTLTRMACICFMEYRFDEGMIYLEKAAAKNPENVHVLNARGLMYKMMGDVEGH